MVTTGPSTRAYRHGSLISAGFPVEDVSDLLAAHPDTVVWVDLCAPQHGDLLQLAAELSLHELAVEDALRPHQRPKLDHYDTHQFLSVRAVTVEPDTGRLVETEIDAFINSRWIITIRQSDQFQVEHLTQRWDRISTLAGNGVDYLLYGVLDLVVDQYFAAVDQFDAYYDGLSEALFGDDPLTPAEQQQWFRMRQSLVRFHRLVISMREAVTAVMRWEHAAPGSDMFPYYQDVYDHILRIVESTDALRDLGATIVETDLALRDYRQNQVTKKITSWAAIIAIPTLITGYYGMNVPYPGAGSEWGVVLATTLSLGIPVGLYFYFRRREWL